MLQSVNNTSGSLGEGQPTGVGTVVLGSSLGSAFEWYDFFVYGTLATTLGPLFFSKQLGETGTLLAALATYGTGLLARPLGSAVFGRMGDRVGRKRMFVATILLMGISTALIGALPTYETAGMFATILLVALRCVQGFALGGEYGGAATYLAEHAPPGRRGYFTGWLQTCTTLGFFLSLVIVLGTQRLTGDAFKIWGWRIPFLVSLVLVTASAYVRTRLVESPVFEKMHGEGRTSPRPLSESFATWPNLKRFLLALFGISIGVGIVWYTSQLYALVFLQRTLGVDTATACLMMAAALAMALPFYVVFGKISDRVGRKPVMLVGFLFAGILYIPLFHALAHYVNPSLEAAATRSPVVLTSNDCSVRFFSGPVTECDRFKDFLVASGIQHQLVTADGNGAMLSIAGKNIAIFDAKAVRGALSAAGYPEKADTDAINYPMAVAVLFVLALFACAAYGVLAAYMAELFPARIRYTSVSMPIHVGSLFGGFMLYFATLISSATGNIFDGLWYSIALISLSFVVGIVGLPETKSRDIYQ